MELQALFPPLSCFSFWVKSWILMHKISYFNFLIIFISLKSLLCSNSWDHLGVERLVSWCTGMIGSCITKKGKEQDIKSPNEMLQQTNHTRSTGWAGITSALDQPQGFLRNFCGRDNQTRWHLLPTFCADFLQLVNRLFAMSLSHDIKRCDKDYSLINI